MQWNYCIRIEEEAKGNGVGGCSVLQNSLTIPLHLDCKPNYDHGENGTGLTMWDNSPNNQTFSCIWLYTTSRCVTWGIMRLLKCYTFFHPCSIRSKIFMFSSLNYPSIVWAQLYTALFFSALYCFVSPCLCTSYWYWLIVATMDNFHEHSNRFSLYENIELSHDIWWCQRHAMEI